MNNFYFEPVKLSQKTLIHNWLAQPHIKEWIHGVGLQNTLHGLEKFFQRESTKTYWVGYDNDIPFAFLITSPEGNDATTLDLFICNLDYLGKGIAVPMIQEFLISHFPNVNKVLIDPEATNVRAVHVYQKAGFKITGEFIASWHPVPHYQMELDMNDLLGLKTNKIIVTPYNPDWQKLFDVEASKIKEALGANCIAIHHIGSTSVPGLSAKPVIDMLPVVRNIQEVDKAAKAMESLGYEVKGEYGIVFRRYFQKGKNIRTHNVHVYQEADPEISRYLTFRDWMSSHPSDAHSYGNLKLELAKKFPHDILQYCNGKDAFVASIDAKNGFDGWRIVKALTDREWDAVRLLRDNYFFKSKEDPYTWTFTHKDHVHLVFYKNAEIIGYAHLQFWPEYRAALRIIVIDESYRKLGFGSQFLRLCERWLYHQGFKKLLIQSSQEAYQFYRKHGYAEISFNDPDGYETDAQDIEIGKCLTIDPIDRPKISIYIATSIDGYIARKDGGLDWLDRVGGFDEDYGFQKLLGSIDALIIGRKTYEVATTVPDPYPGKRVVVLSNSLNSVRQDMELYRGDLAELLSSLHRDGIKHIWIDGGATISQFLSCRMVDTMTLSIIPVILGSGIPLFYVIDQEIPCRVISSQAYPSGLVQLKYEIVQQPDVSQIKSGG
jgi:GrpB-like predicted nucleotidyltransferase (UPF0157 family)/dihydrofolate reductase/GNAT superfamily N-acetyltransferase